MQEQVLKGVKTALSSKVTKEISKSIAADTKKTAEAIDVVTPMLVSAIGRNVQQSNGAKSLAKAISEDHDGSKLKNLEKFVKSQKEREDGRKIIGHVFNESEQKRVVESLSNKIGISEGQIKTILATVAPVVLEQLGGVVKHKNLDTNSIVGLLTSEKKEADNILGSLTQLLDANRNGSVLDEIWNFIMRLLGR